MNTSNKTQEHLRTIKNDLQYYREQIESIRTALTSIGVDISKFKNYPHGVQSSPDSDALLKAMIRIDEFENKLSEKTKEATDFINQLHDMSKCRVLILYYIGGVKIVKIAKMMNCTPRRINQIKKEAIVQLNELF